MCIDEDDKLGELAIANYFLFLISLSCSNLLSIIRLSNIHEVITESK